MTNENPFMPFSDWTKHWQQFFQNDFWGSIQPLLPSSNSKKPSSGMNIYKKDNELLVVISLPGLEKIEDAEVYVSYKTLEVKATINLNFKGFELVEEGLFQGQFQKTIPLPFAVKEDRIEATYHNGLLFIHLHRLIPDEPKKKIVIKKSE
ncbi:Hsp20/alpha crystallin family protein [Geobacillus sp. FJAT-46040]|uniref:Hsp20/alpha crystallin family protein n=1 Tax=Geobacillus TaxID=129337 RepID=UPI000BB88F23|nr:Hsp20/alpha crystallin family protein [Geobacillus sp. FJAT-46040]